MEPGDLDNTTRAASTKRRIPKACNYCRHSKAKCDELRPSCSRCLSLRKECEYVEKPKTPEEIKIEQLEHEVALLRRQLNTLPEPWSTGIGVVRHIDSTSPQAVTSNAHSSPSNTLSERPLKRKRSQFFIRQDIDIPSFVSQGILTDQQAQVFFAAFFRGCDRYVPIFDALDNYTAISSRSSLLLNVIVAIGCGVTDDSGIDPRVLQVHLKRWLTTVILSPCIHSLETVQAFLIMACWMPERSLILANATRIALELQLNRAFDRLISLSLNRTDGSETFSLMRNARTWFLLMNLEQILQIDAGNLLELRQKGVRRCRALLDQPFSSKLDVRLFSQVELNHLRTKINENLHQDTDDLLQAVEDARIDIEVWYSDWRRIMETSQLSGHELPSLVANLTIQKHWAEAMAACRAVRATGVHNIDMMSVDQRQMLLMAKQALQSHLHVMLTQPHYLSNFKYAMDFVWAKCAFSFLLLLKLTVLLPDVTHQDLLDQGRALHAELSKSLGYGSSRIYLKLLHITIEKYGMRGQASSDDLESFAPEEFIFEWDFPGLNLFSSPSGWDLLFDQYLLGDDLFQGVNAI